MGSLCFCISLGLYEEQQRHLHVPQCHRDGENTENKPQTSSKLIWLCLSSVPLPLSWTQVIVQCNHITAHLNIHNRHKDLEEKRSGEEKEGNLNIKQHFICKQSSPSSSRDCLGTDSVCPSPIQQCGQPQPPLGREKIKHNNKQRQDCPQPKHV